MFIAHIRESDRKIQTVQSHCEETAERAGCYAEAASLGNTGKIAGLLHDIGKLNADFNDYIQGLNDMSRGEIDHCFAGAKWIRAFAPKVNRQTAALIGRVILSHHGLHDWVTADSEDTYTKRTEKNERYDEILQNLKHTDLTNSMEILFPEAVKEFDKISTELKSMAGESAEAYGFYMGMLERFLQSVLIDADRTNTADFMSGSQTEVQFDAPVLWKSMRQKMQEKLKTFAEKTDSISKQRQSISDRCAAFAAHDVGICKLIVPTGGGKTLSSLRFAVEYANTHPVKHVFYIAPFMSILEQNSDVIREIAGDEAFLEHHSNMLTEVSGDDGMLHEYELRTEKWDAPVIATTMVQFLNALFSGQISAVRRMHRLAGSVIIVDEVQSVPLKCVFLFNLAMNFFSKICGSTIVLCSATQPPFEVLQQFPLLLDAESSMTGDTTADFNVFRRTKLIYLERKEGYSYEEAADICREKFAENGSLLVVVNTKSAAKELYRRLEDTDGAVVFHLSTAMYPEHRRQKIYEMKKLLADKKPVICVTTQLIEAGVDISFGCVVRSLAGMDNAAQAAGRCNRSGEFHRVCPVYVMELREEKLGSLAEIQNAQDISREILELPEDTDFLGVEILCSYFGKLFRNAQGHMVRGKMENTLRYPLPDATDQDLINLLSCNCNRVKRNTHPQRRFSGQAFKTAGTLFSVIDSRTVNVIVNDNAEAEELLQKLEKEYSPKAAVRLLRQAQKYAVSIYPGMERELYDEGALWNMPCAGGKFSVPVLEKRFYHGDYGITAEGGLHEVLCL